MNLIGDSHTRYEVNGRWFRATAGSYFRPNVAGVGLLARAVNNLVAAKSDEAVLDLYAGVGVFGAFAAETAALVTLVESYPPTATDADDNLADYEHVDVIEGGVDAVLPELDEHYDVVIVDPPSAGLGEAMIRLINDHAPARLVYVSGDPTSLARDVKRLAKVGYRLTAAQPIDLAPQTYYLDTVARFEK
jgi:tRNA/tmRNA/rRNA uracil-C5-methylase (TrmA/RlmC/RlmD family)